MAAADPPLTVKLTEANLAVLTAGGHPVYLVRTESAGLWDYHRPIRIRELPQIQFRRHLLMYETRGHNEALELEVVAGSPPSRRELLHKTLCQERA